MDISQTFKRKMILGLCGALVAWIFLASIIPFFTHWTNCRKEAEEAEEYLKSDVCTKADTKSKVGIFSKHCNDARIVLSVLPVVRAFLTTLGDWNICKNDRCIIMVVAIFDNVGRYLLFAMVFAVILILYLKIKYSGQNVILPVERPYYSPYNSNQLQYTSQAHQ